MIQTERVRFRPLTEDDAEFAFRLMTDPEWIRYIGDRGIGSAEDARAYLVRVYLPLYAEPGFGLMGVEVAGELAGVCGILKRDALDDPDLAFAFLPRFRGRGLAREAAEAALRHAYGTLGLTRVAAIVDPENAASIRLLEALGFRFQRQLRLAPDAPEVALYGSGGRPE
jgi:RimJ/RimL family protein N-acetyltransferase